MLRLIGGRTSRGACEGALRKLGIESGVLYKASFIVYDSARDGVLLEETDGCVALPRVEVAVSEPGMVAPINAAVRERFGLDVITLRYVPTAVLERTIRSTRCSSWKRAIVRVPACLADGGVVEASFAALSWRRPARRR